MWKGFKDCVTKGTVPAASIKEVNLSLAEMRPKHRELRGEFFWRMVVGIERCILRFREKALFCTLYYVVYVCHVFAISRDFRRA